MTNIECALKETPECRQFENTEELIQHMFDQHDLYLCYLCFNLSDEFDEHLAHLATHDNEPESLGVKNSTNDEHSPDKACQMQPAVDDKRLSENNNNNNDKAAEVPRKENHCQLRNETKINTRSEKAVNSGLVSVDEESPPCLEANPPISPSQRTNSFPELHPHSPTEVQNPVEASQTSQKSDLASRVHNTRASSRSQDSPSKAKEDGKVKLSTKQKSESKLSIGYKCSSCPKSFITDNDLKLHMLSDHSEKLNIQESSDASTTKLGDKKIFTCPVCGKKEYDELLVISHIKERHGNPEKRNFGCPGQTPHAKKNRKPVSCRQLFTDAITLYNHMKTYHAESPNNSYNGSSIVATSVISAPVVQSNSRTVRKRTGQPPKVSLRSKSRRHKVKDDDDDDNGYNDGEDDEDDQEDEDAKVYYTPRQRKNGAKESNQLVSKPQNSGTRRGRKSAQSESEVKYPCQCGKEFSSMKELYLHRVKDHPDTKFYVCVECGYIPYGSVTGLQKHQTEKHPT